MDNNVAGKLGLDPTLPDVPLILGGKLRHLCYDFAAIVQVEKVTGINLLAAAVSTPSFTVLGCLLWAALLRESPELTLDQVGLLVTPANSAYIHAAVLSAWFKSTSDPSDQPQTKARAKGKRKAQAKPAA